MSGSANTNGTAPQPLADATWLPFDGTAERRGTSFRLTAKSRNGSIELGEYDVGFDRAGGVYVRRGAVVAHVDEPWFRDTRGRPPQPAVTACVGTVLIDCGDFRAIATAVGSWGCERPAYVPP